MEAVASPPSLDELTFGVLEEPDPTVADAVRDRTGAAIDALADAGASVRRIRSDHFEMASALKDVVSQADLACH